MGVPRERAAEVELVAGGSSEEAHLGEVGVREVLHLYARRPARDLEEVHRMGVGGGEAELEPARPLPDREGTQGYAAQVHLELARSRLDGRRERTPR